AIRYCKTEVSRSCRRYFLAATARIHCAGPCRCCAHLRRAAAERSRTGEHRQLFVVGCRPDLVAAEKHPPSDLPGCAQPAFRKGERVRSLDTPRSRSFRSCPRYHLLDSFASWQGVNRETDERGRDNGRIRI